MNVLERFHRYVSQNRLFGPDDKIVLAVSGGKDSMLMARLFLESNYPVIIAHCNFSLRGEESDLDQQLVEAFGEKYSIPVFVKRFDTQAYAEENKISIQMAARELRYQWFEELRIAQGCAYISVAQHRNDHIETVLLNMIRGTGLAGLQGIQPKREHIIRPLLFLLAGEVAEAVRFLQVPYRDDQSNFSVKYARNKIRLNIVPLMEEINPEFVQSFASSIDKFAGAYQLLQDFVNPVRQSLFKENKVTTEVLIEKKSLEPYLTNAALLYELFQPYHFQKNVLEDLVATWENGTGRIFESYTHRLLVDRTHLILHPTGPEVEAKVCIEESDEQAEWKGFRFNIEKSSSLDIVKEKHIAKIDWDKLQFPLQIRSWQEGDIFYPLGMEGKKKVSDYFIQQKINSFAKARIPILVDGTGEIIWIVNYRLDNRFKITNNTKKVFTLVCE
ncbi:tRNA lysidine(34) synthetase TilS [Sphingobacterium spiritivorum]